MRLLTRVYGISYIWRCISFVNLVTEARKAPLPSLSLPLLPFLSLPSFSRSSPLPSLSLPLLPLFPLSLPSPTLCTQFYPPYNVPLASLFHVVTVNVEGCFHSLLVPPASLNTGESPCIIEQGGSPCTIEQGGVLLHHWPRGIPLHVFNI